MTNNNDLINLVNNKKPVELVQELKDYEIKKSPLSSVARSKVISKNGSNYVSENKGGYGPVIDPDLKAEGRKAREKEEELNKKWGTKSEKKSNRQGSTGKSIAMAVATAVSTATLGPIGTIGIGTVAMIAGDSFSKADKDVGDSLCESGFELITGGAIDGAVGEVIKKK